MTGQVIIPAGLHCQVKPDAPDTHWRDYMTREPVHGKVSIDDAERLILLAKGHLIHTTVADLYASERRTHQDGRIRVLLSEDDFGVVQELATARDAKKGLYGAMTYGDVLDSTASHRSGLAAEMAICRLGQSALDRQVYATHGDNGIDCKLPILGKTGVKSTSYAEQPYLRVEIEHFRTDIDVYVLCYVHWSCPRSVWVIGWATGKEVKMAPQSQFVPGGPMNYVLQEHQLHRWHVKPAAA